MRHPSQDVFTIRLSLREGKLVFEALAELPFKYVYDLIGKINRQANNTGVIDDDEATRYPYTMNRRELTLTIRALGEMPFNRVHALVNNLNDQIRQQIDPAPLYRDLISYDRA